MQEYKQTTQFTGAASSLMMIVHHYKPEFELTRDNEFAIWMSSVNLPTRACSIYALSRFAYERGLAVEVYVGKQEYDYPDYRFKGYKKEEIDAATFTEEIYLKKLKDSNIKINVGEFTLGKVKELVKQGKIIMIRLDAGVFRDIKPSSSYIIITGYSAKGFEIYDPYAGKLVVSEDDMQSSFEDLATKRRRDHRMIVFYHG